MTPGRAAARGARAARLDEAGHPDRVYQRGDRRPSTTGSRANAEDRSRGTPKFIVNGRRSDGNSDLAQLDAAIARAKPRPQSRRELEMSGESVGGFAAGHALEPNLDPFSWFSDA